MGLDTTRGWWQYSRKRAQLFQNMPVSMCVNRGPRQRMFDQWMTTKACFSLYLFSLLWSNFFQTFWSICFIIHGQCASLGLWIHGGGCYVQEKDKSPMRWKPSATLASWALSNFPSSSVTWWMHINHEPMIFLFYNIHFILLSFYFCKPIKSFNRHVFQWLHCVSKLLGWIPWLCYNIYSDILPHGSPIAVSMKCSKRKQFTSLCFPAEEWEA